MKKISLHPILMALLPIISLYEHNVEQLAFREVWGTLLAAFVLSLILWGLIRLVVKDTIISALMATIFWILFFGIRPMFLALGLLATSLGWIDDRFQWVHSTRVDWVVLILCILLFLCVSILLKKTKHDLTTVNQFVNWVVIVLLGWNIFLIGKANMETRGYRAVGVYNKQLTFIEQLTKRQQDKIEATVTQNHPEYPDIYMIILDGYGRADTLQELYNYDNSTFLGELSSREFYIAEESSSNYNRTIQSLASSLNLMYLDPLAEQFGDTNSFSPAIDMIQNNAVFGFLEQRGYHITTFASGFLPTEIQDADEYLSPKDTVDAFQSLVLNSSPFSMMFGEIAYDAHRSRILFALEEIPKVHDNERPIFVFAHIISPHPPFIFDSEGNSIKLKRDYVIFDGDDFMKFGTSEEYIDGYTKQVSFINQKTLEMVDAILDNAKKPTIIIIQGDHGPGLRLNFSDVEQTDLSERMPIFNAYYFSENDYNNLYESITPINSLRIVLNQYLGTNLELLEDRNYFMPHETPLQPIDVTELVRQD